MSICNITLAGERDIPSLSGRVERGLEPAEIARLKLVVDADEGQLSFTGAFVDIDGGMAAVVPSGYGDSLGLEVYKGLRFRLSSAVCGQARSGILTAYVAARPEARVIAYPSYKFGLSRSIV